MSTSGCSMCNKKITRISDCVICDICRNSMHVTCAGLSPVKAECIRSANRKINFFWSNCNIVTTINTLKKKFDNLKIELEAVKSRSVNAPSSSKNTSEEDIVREVEDRMQRSCNLVLLNLPESNEEEANLRKQALNCLHSCKLKDRYYLNRYLTPRQQSYCFEIRKELRERRGIEQITLRYKNGIPYIVASEQKVQKKGNYPTD